MVGDSSALKLHTCKTRLDPGQVVVDGQQQVLAIGWPWGGHGKRSNQRSFASPVLEPCWGRWRLLLLTFAFAFTLLAFLAIRWCSFLLFGNKAAKQDLKVDR